MSSTLTIGIIGCGAIGEEHIRCLEALEGVSLRWFCDRDGARAARFVHDDGARRWTTDPADIFADSGVDAVYICTHTDSHAALGIAAARAGKHIMMEKPLALTERECYEIAGAVDRSGVTCMTAFKLRFTTAAARVRAFIPAPTIAVGQMMDVRWPPEFWGNDPVKGGGNVLSQGCHSVDLLCHLAGAEPVRVYAEGGNFHHPGLEIVDTLVATLLFDNGAVGTLVQADAGHTPLTSKFSFQVMDGTRTAHLHNRLMSVTLWDGVRATRHDEKEEVGMLEESRAFLAAIRDHTPPPVGVREGLRATVVLLRAFEAISTRQPRDIRL